MLARLLFTISSITTGSLISSAVIDDSSLYLGKPYFLKNNLVAAVFPSCIIFIIVVILFENFSFQTISLLC
jgi:hypothetical protein